MLPFTVCTSFFLIHARPSLLILFSCSIVTMGFFIGVFLDGTTVSSLGIFFGVASSMITAMHAVVIKKSLEIVKGNALHLSWYTNLFSSAVLAPLVLLAGEGGAIFDMFFGEDLSDGAGVSILRTFIWGSMIAVRIVASTLPVPVTHGHPREHSVSS